jgi:hypothetical protein
MRSPHLLQDCFNVSPGFAFFRLALFLAAASLLSRLNDRYLAMRLKQLSGILMNFHFSHPHKSSSPAGGHPIINNKSARLPVQA